MFYIYSYKLAWRQREVPEEWRKATIVLLHKMKDKKSECNSYRGICMLSLPGKVYRTVVTEKLMDVTEKVNEGQGGFREGKGCIDQIRFAFIKIVEEYIGKGRKIFTAFIYLEKAYKSRQGSIMEFS